MRHCPSARAVLLRLRSGVESCATSQSEVRYFCDPTGYYLRVKRRNSHKNADFHIAIATQGGGLRVVRRHQGGDGGSHLAPYSHWVGFACMGVPPASKMRALGVSGSTKLGAPPIAYKTNPAGFLLQFYYSASDAAEAGAEPA